MNEDYYNQVINGKKPNPFVDWTIPDLEAEARLVRADVDRLNARLSVLHQAFGPKLSKFKPGDVIKHNPSSTTWYVKFVKLDNFRVTNPCAYKDYVLGLYRVDMRDGALNRFKEVTIRCMDKDEREAEFQVVPAKLIDGKVAFEEPPRIRLVHKLQLPHRVADNAELVDQIVRPRSERGVDYGNERLVLIRRGDKELTWEKGSKFFAGRGMQDYAPASLVYRNYAERDATIHGTDIHEGGRLSRKLLKQYDKRIKNLFDLQRNFSDIYVPGTTMVIYDEVRVA